MLFGQTEASRESDGLRVFAWYLDEEQDAANNRIRYKYLRDNHQLYLEEVRYSIFSLHFSYELRPDTFYNGRSGFERIMALRTKSIELHCERIEPTLMRTYTFLYDKGRNGVSMLTHLLLMATEDGEKASFPDLTFKYSTLDFSSWQIHDIRSMIPPPRLGDEKTQLVDMNGDGLPDILQSLGSNMVLWLNRGNGWLDGPVTLKGIPSTVNLAKENVAFADLDGDGQVELFAINKPLQLAFKSSGKGNFLTDPVLFRDRPNFRLAATDTRMMDVNGDGVTDIICTGRSNFLLYEHKAGIGWLEPQVISRVSDLEQFPDITLADRRTWLADMTGDGLQDFVYVQSGNICYWPYLGHGMWGKRVAMQNPPRFSSGYSDKDVYLVDIDGDGCTDVVYIDYDRILIWINQCGISFAAAIEIPVSPISNSRVNFADFFGDGRPGLLWTSTRMSEDSSGYRFLRLGGGQKPYLMTVIENGVGGRFEIEYTTSTIMHLEDQAEGHVLARQLPFVVNIVKVVRELDLIAKRNTNITLRYHDGIYDGLEREFRGFSCVDVDINGDESVPASRQEFMFFQGDPGHIDLVERDRQRALASVLIKKITYEQVNDMYKKIQESVHTWEIRLEHSDGNISHNVYFPFVSQFEIQEYSSVGSPQRINRIKMFEYDLHGNYALRIHESFADGEPPEKWIRTYSRYTYTNNTVRWLVKLPVRLEMFDNNLVPLAVKIMYYDGPSFIGLPEGEVTEGLLTRVKESSLFEERFPSDYVGNRNLSVWGYELMGEAENRGYYVVTFSVKRDEQGNVIEKKDPLGRSLTISYDNDGVYPVKIKDPLGNETTFLFNPRAGEASKTTLPDGRIIRAKYDPIGRLLAQFESDEHGQEQLVKCWILNILSKPSSITSIAPRSGGRKLAEFISASDFESLQDVSISRIYYDGFGKEALQISLAPDSQDNNRRFVTSRQVTRNSKGWVSTRFSPFFVPNLSFLSPPNPDPAKIRHRYDLYGNILETLGPGPVHFGVEHDTFSIKYYEGIGAGVDTFGEKTFPGPSTRAEYFDALSRLIRIEENNVNETVTTSYDLTADGRIRAILDSASKEISRYTFAGPSKPIRILNGDVGARTYYRDAAGLLVERIDHDGSKLLYSYDALGRLTRIEYVAANGETRYPVREITYDSDPELPSNDRFLHGQIAIASELGTKLRYSYNHSGRITREELTVDGITLVTNKEYDLQGHLTAIVYNDDRRVDYKLDASGAVKEIPGVVKKISYNSNCEMEGYSLSNGVEIVLPRDHASRRLVDISARKNTTVQRRIGYAYDSVGNITSISDEIPGSTEYQVFTYDSLHRLSSVEVHQNDISGPVLHAGKYSYDMEGNIRQFEDTQPVILDYTDLLHPGRLTSYSINSIKQGVTYNIRGAISALDDMTTIEYDPLDRLSSLKKEDGTEIRFLYDLQNRRVLKEIKLGTVTKNIYYAGGVYEQHDTYKLHLIYLGGRLICTEKISLGASDIMTPNYYLSDHLGTILMVTDANGDILHNQRFSPFGASLNDIGTPDRPLGIERDVETGLLHLGARYFCSKVGRFISPDWFILENPDKAMRIPQGYNMYAYALNNPLAFKDPSGMFVELFITGFTSGLHYGWFKEDDIDTRNAFEIAIETGFATLGGGFLGLAFGGGFMGVLNGLMSGVHGTYNWESAEGWFAFLSDSTFSIFGTAAGNFVHFLNMFGSNEYWKEQSYRQNRHVYNGGVYLKEDFILTQGNVVTNAKSTESSIRTLNDHENLHIWQQRLVGPAFQLGYLNWAIAGLMYALTVPKSADQNLGDVVTTAVYFDNPFEHWAYSNDKNWPPGRRSGNGEYSDGFNPDTSIWAAGSME
jgi:RHS repeat-associated protein